MLLLIVIALSLSNQQSSKAEKDMVSVQLVNYLGEPKELHLYLSGNFVTTDPTIRIIEGVKYRLSVQENALLLEGGGLKHKIKSPLILVPERYDTHHVLRINRRPYLGAMEFRIQERHFIRPVNQLSLEDYLKGVVPFEVYPTWELDALKAQALAARTYAATKLKKEIDDTIGYQVYGGYTWHPRTTKAVEETRGEVVTHQNRLIEALYSASNGGMTESNANVWGGNAISYYPIKPDPFDPIDPWEFRLHQTQIDVNDIGWDYVDWWDRTKEKDDGITASMKKWLHRKGYHGELKILTIPRFELSGHRLASHRSVKGSIEIEFLRRLLDGTVLFETVKLDDVPLSHIRPMIGGHRFKSYFIESLTLQHGIYSMKGKGYGHGVGMSQWGAHYMALQGKTYKEILQFYFPGTSVTQLNLP